MPDDTPAPILLTGFDPFAGESVNPSWEAVRALDGEHIHGHRIVAHRLPVAFDASRAVLDGLIADIHPELVLCVGQAGGRAQLSIERVAINIADARIPDNAGACPIDASLVDDAPAAYFSNLPIKAMLAELREAGIPAEISQTAGTYVCNAVFYGLMHGLQRRAGMRGGFVHIPYSPEQAAAHPGAPSLSTNIVIAALRIILGVALTTREDRRIAAGAEH
jgi:pyroglutamyl-peptidase